jgi:magnesium-transporting ATPase (P-type)
MLSLKNHLAYWGNIIIPVAGLCFGYFYYIRTDEFIPNPLPVLTKLGFYTLCQSTTVVFLLIQLPFALNAFFLHSSKPFKQKIYDNWVLLAIIVVNLIADVVYFFICKNGIKALGLVPISVKQGGILLAITVTFLIISYFYNWWI